eukprot:20655-Heterococcus_DN1.PRE.1
MLLLLCMLYTGTSSSTAHTASGRLKPPSDSAKNSINTSAGNEYRVSKVQPCIKHALDTAQHALRHILHMYEFNVNLHARAQGEAVAREKITPLLRRNSTLRKLSLLTGVRRQSGDQRGAIVAALTELDEREHTQMSK